MAGESQQLPTSQPDPSVITTEIIMREVEHVRVLMSTRIESLEEMLNERYDTQVKATDKAFDAQQTAMQTAFTAADKAVDKALEAAEKAVDKALTAAEKAVDHRQAALDKEFHEHLEQVRHENALAFINSDKAVQAALASAKEAVTKAETANEKRFEGQNEFRAQLGDQANTFLPRNEYNASHNNLVERVSELNDRLTRAEGSKLGVIEQKTDQRLNVNMLVGVGGLVLAAVIFLLATWPR